jgi:hypothetical protein
MNYSTSINITVGEGREPVKKFWKIREFLSGERDTHATD